MFTIRILRALSLLTAMILAGYISGCGSDTETGRDLTLDSFSFLKEGMAYEEIVAQVGEPDRDRGSGMYLFEYDLADDSRVVLQFIGRTKLSQAWLVKPDGTREVLIGLDE